MKKFKDGDIVFFDRNLVTLPGMWVDIVPHRPYTIFGVHNSWHFKELEDSYSFSNSWLIHAELTKLEKLIYGMG